MRVVRRGYVFPAAPAELTEADISMEDAIAAAKNEMTIRQGVPPDGFGNYRIKASFVTLENGEKAWVVMLDELSMGLDALVTISQSGASIIDYRESDTEITSLLIDLWTGEKGAMKTWALEDKALFNFMFGNDDRYVFPGESHISRDAARDIALSAVPGPVSSPEITYAFKLLSYTDGRPERYVWIIAIHENGREKYVVHVSATDGAVLDIY